ncbi:MAG: Y-family DNA polymerase [Pseudomonadota bacterium]
MTSSSPESRELWLCLHFSQLPLEIFLRSLPEDIQAKPVVVVRKHRVCCLNSAAAAIGIEPGHSMDTTYSLCDEVICFERDEAREFAVLSQLAQWTYQYTPGVVIRAPDSLLLEISGCLRLFRGLANLKDTVQVGLSRLGHHPLTGVNRTPLAALLSARCGLADNTDDVKTSVEATPVTWLEVDARITEALMQMGIHDIKSLLALPGDGINRRFGVYFSDYLARLLGHRPDPQKFISPAPHFHSEITFLQDVENTSALLFPMKRLLGELCLFLDARQLATTHLAWRLAHRAQQPVSFSIHLANPEKDAHIFLPLTQLKLDQVKGVREIDSIALTVSQFSAAAAQAGDLFHGTRYQQKDGRLDTTGAAAQANQLLNMLNTRLGDDICFGISLANDHRPEKAWQRVRFGQAPVRLPDGAAGHNPRPAFLLAAPRPLQVIDGAPCLGGRLELLKGPERIDSGWWDRPSVNQPAGRDYYVARQKGGSLFWIFEYPAGQQATRWFLHGIFS